MPAAGTDNLIQGQRGQGPGVGEPVDGAAELFLDLGDGAVGAGGPVFEQDHPVAEPFDFFHLVGDHDDGRAGEFLVFDDVHQQAPVDRVEALGRFVQDQQFGVVHDGHAELDFLLLPAGELIQPGGGLVGEVDPFQVVPGPGFRPRLVQALEPAEVDHHIQHGLFLVQAALLGQVPEPGPVLRGEGLAADVQGPGGGLVDPQQRPECGGLPGPVAAEEPEGFPGPDIEGQVFDDRSVPEVHPEVLDVYQRLGGRVPQRHGNTLTGVPSPVRNRPGGGSWRGPLAGRLPSGSPWSTAALR